MDLTSLGGGGGGPNDRALFVKKHCLESEQVGFGHDRDLVLSDFFFCAKNTQGSKQIIADKRSTKCKDHPDQKCQQCSSAGQFTRFFVLSSAPACRNYSARPFRQNEI